MLRHRKLLTALLVALVVAGCGVARQPNTQVPVAAPSAPEAGKEVGASDPSPALGAPVPAPVVGTNPVTAAPAPPSPQSLRFTTLSKGGHSGVEDRKAVLVMDEAQWRSLWQTHAAMQVPTPPAPAVDFQQGAVLAVYMGQKNTGGYAVEVTEVKLVDGKLQVTVRQTVPGPGAITTQALTQPFHLVSIPAVPQGTKVEVYWQ